MSSIAEYRGRGQPAAKGRGNPAKKTRDRNAFHGRADHGGEQPNSANAESGQSNPNLEDQIKQGDQIAALPAAVASGRLKNFVPLPSDPGVNLTPGQLAALFPPGPARDQAIKEILKLGMIRAERSSWS